MQLLRKVNLNGDSKGRICIPYPVKFPRHSLAVHMTAWLIKVLQTIDTSCYSVCIYFFFLRKVSDSRIDEFVITAPWVEIYLYIPSKLWEPNEMLAE